MGKDFDVGHFPVDTKDEAKASPTGNGSASTLAWHRFSKFHSHTDGC